MNFRQWIEAVRPQEGEEMVTLYRGDAGPIKSFSLGKADPKALFGLGIYFTDSPRLGGDYTAKGQDVIFRYGGNWGKKRATKQQAIEAYVWRLAQYVDENGNKLQWGASLPAFSDDPIRIKRMKQAEKQWNQMKNDVEIRSQTDGSIVIRKKSHPGTRTAIQIPKRALQQTLDAEQEISKEAATALADVLRRLGDEGTARDTWNYATTADEDGFLPTWRQIYTSITADSPIVSPEGQLMLRRKLKELGYTGIRYAGGVTMGGRKHNAYVFWDEQGINKLPRTTQRPRRK